jgi:mRNA interferase RelE/StbE
VTGRHEIRFDLYARKALDAIDKPDRRRILVRVGLLADNPRPAGAIMLKGDWRIRVGDYRVIYTVDHETLVVLVIDIARRLEPDRELRAQLRHRPAEQRHRLRL